MKLRVFDSLKRIATTDGRVVRGLPNKAALSHHPPPRWIWELEPTNASEASRALDQLSSSLEKHQNAPDMIVFQTMFHSVEDSLSYLREILPVSAHFLEAHPTIAESYGRRNAHGNPFNDHVVGICHHFPNHNITDLTLLLDVFLPTRLALSSSNLVEVASCSDDDLETLVQNTDLIYHEDDNQYGIWNQVWKAHQQDRCHETYAICDDVEEIRRLRRLYAEFQNERET
jgi:hypothetical protein